MLNRAKLLQALQAQKDNLFLDTQQELTIAQEAWQRLSTCPTFAQKARVVQSPWSIPRWQDDLTVTFSINPISNYTVVAVDGSQIYPDKHQGTSCFLINVGMTTLSYGSENATFSAYSQPYVYSSGETEDAMLNGTIDIVNCKRQEHELLMGYELCVNLKKNNAFSPILLFDGSLIFWHLESKAPEIKHHFLTSYVTLLQRLHQAGIVVAGYISLPKSKDLINLVRLELCNFQTQYTQLYQPVENLVDSCVVQSFLEPGQYSIMFQSTSPITNYYPAQVQPYFYYMDVGNEIVRIELPAWIAQDTNLVSHLSDIIYDQALKGRGYPVALAESHEQAVVKGPDRDFFYHLINKMGIEQQRYLIPSSKSLKKRSISI